MGNKRLQLASGWHGPTLVIGAEGTTKVVLSYWGLPTLVSPEQCCQPSSDEVEMLEWLEFEEDWKELINKFKSVRTQSGLFDKRVQVEGREVQGHQPEAKIEQEPAEQLT